MQRICFTLQVRPDKLAEYRQSHTQVWPEMQQALTQSGWKDYTLFLRPDGLLIGYLVTENFEAAKTAMENLEVNQRWQQSMAPFFEGIDLPPDASIQPIEEVFHLD